MKKIIIALTATVTLCGCSGKDKSSVPSEIDVIIVPETSADATPVIEEATTAESELPYGVEQDRSFQILEVEGDGVTVDFKNNTMQKIEIDCTELLRMAEIYDIDPENMLVVGDYNFDGYDDLFVPETTLNANTPGTYYYFNPTVNFNPFEEWDELNEIGFLMKADSEKKILNFSSHISAIDHDWIIYKWKAGKLHPVSREYQYQSVYDNQIYINRFEYDDDGKEILVKRKRAVLGENNEWLGTEDVELG